VKTLQSVTLTQALVMALLVLIAAPTYLAWRVINDDSMLTKFTSHYEEISNEQMPCTLRIGSVRGGGYSYSITTGFAHQGSDRWTVGVIMARKPDPSEQVSYCATLVLLVDHLRSPNQSAPEPTFPGGDTPMIWHYPAPEQP